jgi:murein DD-endopeptidase MepM/ murein hydrolase activator NlpD
LPTTNFTEQIVKENGLDKLGFSGWCFRPGMLFDSHRKWWGDEGMRITPHEGCDICLYRNGRGEVLRLDEKGKIPAMYDGTVMAMIHDFLGKSIYMEHAFSDDSHNRFCTFYGHLDPNAGLQVGSVVEEGEIIATLAGSAKSKAGIFPHLHISAAWVPETIPLDQLDWGIIGERKALTLVDPLLLIGGQADWGGC